MKAPVKLTAAITLTFAALAVALWIEIGTEILFPVVPPLLAFAGIHTVLLRVNWSGRPVEWPRLLWSGIIIVSLIVWLLFFGCISPTHSSTVGIDDDLPEPKTFLEQPWFVHRIYMALFREVFGGGVGSVISAAVISLSVLLPILIFRSVTELRRLRHPRKAG